MNNREILDEFLIDMKRKGVKEDTYKAYERDLTELLDYVGDKSVIEVDKAFVDNYMQELKLKYRDNSVYRIIASLKLFYRKLYEKGRMSTLVVEQVKVSKGEGSIPEVITEEEASTLFSLPYIDNKQKRDKVLMKLLYETGIQLSEGLAIKKSDIDGRTLKLNKKSKKHILKVSEELAKEFINYYDNDLCGEEIIFKGLTRQSFSARVKTYGKEAKLAKEITPVKLKNSAIYNFIEEGVSIRELKDRLDYANIGMSGIYKIRNKSDIKKIYESIAIGDWNVSEDI